MAAMMRMIQKVFAECHERSGVLRLLSPPSLRLVLWLWLLLLSSGDSDGGILSQYEYRYLLSYVDGSGRRRVDVGLNVQGRDRKLKLLQNRACGDVAFDNPSGNGANEAQMLACKLHAYKMIDIA